MGDECLMPPDPQRKSVIRQQMIQARSGLDKSDRAKANLAIQNHIHKHWDDSWQTILIYANLADEAATIPLILEMLGSGKRICVPSFDPVLKNYFPSELKDFENEMQSGRMGILEPMPSAQRPVPTSDLDVIFLPGVAFDREGNRVGYGYGYFDRISHATRAVKIGLAYHFQLVDAVPAHDNDVPVNLIITDKEVISCPKQ